MVISDPRSASAIARRGRKAGCTSDGDLSAKEPRELTLYLEAPGLRRRRPGSGAAIAELSKRISREQLRQELERLLETPIAVVRRYAGITLTLY
jgi:hypothetical protein